jgi:3-oxosteroid 1-dehydrogenase
MASGASSAGAGFDEVVDVVVVGTGAAGCAAALGALLHGAGKVLLLEKSKRLVGGTTRIAGGGWLWCPNNRFLNALGVVQRADEIVALLQALAYPEGQAVDAGDLELMRAFAEEWPGVIETIQREKFMELQAVDVRDAEDHAVVERLLRAKMAADPSFSTKTGISERNIKALSALMPSYCAEHPLDLCPSGKVLAPSGGTTSRQLEKSVLRFAERAEIRMGASVVDLVLGEGGRCVGVRVLADPNSKAVRTVRARRGVVFASGGFSHNPQLLKEHFGPGVLGTCAAPTNTGDFALICQRHGIPLSGMDRAWFKQVVVPYKFPQRIGVFFLNGDSFLVVNRTGCRFACEKNFYQQRGMQMFNQPQNKLVFYVFDERSRERYEGPIKSLGSPIPAADDNDDIVRGANVHELAQGLRVLARKIDPDFTLEPTFERELEQQLARFNQYARAGQDLEFGRGDNAAEYCWHTKRAPDNKFPNKTMMPLETNKLCAVAMALGTLDTKGGPRINRHAQVLDAYGRPLQGLYGAGNCVRSATNYSYPASGATLANAILFGFLGGRHAMAPHATKL